jgi:predicted regulator of Ras-like GTPase activity (Roadblock/LC7/MglB family)
MDDLTAIKGVLGYAVYVNDSQVSGSAKGKLGDKVSEIEQFWINAASVISNNLSLGEIKEVALTGKDRQVLMVMGNNQMVLCELEPQANWKSISIEVRGRM